jgi:putative oxidoreductase
MGGRFLYWLVRTDMNFAALAARLTLGLSMWPAGWQKLNNFSATMKAFTEGMGIPAPFAFLVILAESFGALGLIFGVFSRFCAFGNGLVMIGAILMVHGQHGFRLMDQANPDPGKMGWAYNFALLGLAVVVMLAGAGAFSFDRWLTKRLQAPDAPVA